MNKLYQFRGYILGALALALLAMPAQPVPALWALQSGEASIDGAALQPTFPLVPVTGTLLMAWLCLCAFVFLASVFLRVKSRQYIGEHSRGKCHEADGLVTEGPYAIIRHPLYLSNLGIAYSFILFHLGPSFLAFPFLIATAVFEVVLSRAEDRFLQARFGDVWVAWARETPAFILKKIPKKKPDTPKRTFLQAFLADRSTWAWLLFFNLVLYLKKLYVG